MASRPSSRCRRPPEPTRRLPSARRSRSDPSPSTPSSSREPVRRNADGDRLCPAARASRLDKRLSQFEFDFQPSIDRAVIAELSTLRFVEERRNALFLGPPGVGKSHLAIALGIAATEAGVRPHLRRPGTLEMGRLEVADEVDRGREVGPVAGPRHRRARLPADGRHVGPLDLPGRVPPLRAGLDRLTSNRGFGDWGQVFADQVVATAILDRLLHHATVVNIKGQMRAHMPSGREGSPMLG